MKIESKIKELFCTIIEMPEEGVKDDTSPENCDNWDSYKQMFLVAAFEEEFDISIEPEEIIAMYKSYHVFKNVITNKLG